MQNDLERLRRKVLDVARKTGLISVIEHVGLEADQDENGTEFLRVLVSITDFSKTTDDELAAFLEEVEREVGILDQRYPSVRFLDAPVK